MDKVIFNFIFYIFIFFFFYKEKNKMLNLINLIYLVSSFFSVLLFLKHPYRYNLSYLGFIYTFLFYTILIQPVRFKIHLLKDELMIYKSKFNLLIILYVISSIIYTFFTYKNALHNFITSSWSLLRYQFYQGNVIIYENQLQRISGIVIIYFRIYIIIYLFVFLSDKKNQFTIKHIIILFSLIIPLSLMAINTASRGVFIDIVLPFFLMYLLLHNNYTDQIKKVFYIISFLFFSFILYILSTITISRFGIYNTYDSLLEYFGIPMLTFNSGIFNNLNDFGYGAYSFNWLYKIIYSNNFLFNKLGGNYGTNFYSIFGDLYLDFGPIFSIFIVCIFVFIIKYFLYNNLKYNFSIFNIIIVLTYCIFLIKGVFVLGKGYTLPIFFIIIIYYFLKYKLKIS